MQQLRFILRKCFILHISGDSPTHHQEFVLFSKFRLLGVNKLNICGSVHHAFVVK